MLRLIAELYPICRSITGDGLRETLRLLQRQIPLELRKCNGTQYSIGLCRRNEYPRRYVKNAKVSE